MKPNKSLLNNLLSKKNQNFFENIPCSQKILTTSLHRSFLDLLSLNITDSFPSITKIIPHEQYETILKNSLNIYFHKRVNQEPTILAKIITNFIIDTFLVYISKNINDTPLVLLEKDLTIYNLLTSLKPHSVNDINSLFDKFSNSSLIEEVNAIASKGYSSSYAPTHKMGKLRITQSLSLQFYTPSIVLLNTEYTNIEDVYDICYKFLAHINSPVYYIYQIIQDSNVKKKNLKSHIIKHIHQPLSLLEREYILNKQVNDDSNKISSKPKAKI